MVNWQEPKPRMKIIECGRPFAPEYGQALTDVTVDPAEWEHVCSARFGLGRPCSFNDKTLWTGDSYRYDIFLRKSGRYGGEYALRWWNGSGEGWLIAEDKDRRGESCLLSMIAAMGDETRRWDACHFLWKAAHMSAVAAAATAANEIKQAFVDGLLKKRKRGGVVRVTIEPKKLTV